MNPSPQPKTSLFDRLLGLIEVVKPSDRFILRVLFFLVIFSGAAAALSISDNYSSNTPISGGHFKEGVIGTPRFVNPVLASTRADQDVTALIYSGLMRIRADGVLEPDLAEAVTISGDGLTYNIIVRKDLYFHDGSPITARDVVFTLELIQDGTLKSPLRGNWSNVSIEGVGDYELNVVLSEPYAPFAENFTVGILPAHLWSDIAIDQIPFSKLNTEPVGSGPFKLKRMVRDESGLITSYELVSHTEARPRPNIETFEFMFFPNETALIDALGKQQINASAYVANENIAALTDSGKYRLIKSPLPRIFGIFFNQNKSAALRDPAAREALSVAIDRTSLVEKTLAMQGVPISTALPPLTGEVESSDGLSNTASSTRREKAKNILRDAGWVENNLGLLEKQIDNSPETLSITLRTSNASLFTSITEVVADEWKAIGVEVTTEQFEQAGLVQSVIRPRDFQALLFGLDMSRSGDLYPFWHSSQKTDPGLNIAQYTNLSVDALLERAQTEQDDLTRQKTLMEASTVIESERPAIFLFQSDLTYVVASDVVISPIVRPGKTADRFSNVSSWYTDSDTLWNIFRQRN